MSKIFFPADFSPFCIIKNQSRQNNNFAIPNLIVYISETSYQHMRTLEEILKLDDNEIRDDDHLFRPDITKEEFANALDEIIVKYKLKVVEKKKPSEFGLAALAALNSM